MKRSYSLPIYALLLCTALQSKTDYSDNRCHPLEGHRLYVMPKVGVAPGFFSSRDHVLIVIPKLGISCPVTSSDTPTPCSAILTSPENIFLQACSKEKQFSTLFSNGVLHVGGEIGYNTNDEHSQYFIDFIYNHAKGNNCIGYNLSLISALDGCCDNTCPNCDNPLATTTYTASITPYKAFGLYLGGRHYFNSLCCDRFSLFVGGKIGLLHRKQASSTATVPAVVVNGVTIIDQRSQTSAFFCKNNVLSAGLQIGCDYSLNNCLSLMLGVEVVASAPAKINRNVATPIPASAVGPAFDPYGANFSTNVSVGPVGHFIQFPVWAGLRWEWDWRTCCNS